jgi:ubiquinol-cytochrome c reductase cytochrome c subunit
MNVARVTRSIPFALLAAAATFGFTAPGRESSSRRTAVPPLAPASAARTVYLRDCAVCHGADARGDLAPSLLGVGRASLDYWLSTGRMPLVANARPAKSPQGVPPPGQRLADPEAEPRRGLPAYSAAGRAALEDYILSIAPGGPGIPNVDLEHADLATGGQVFREQCAACHAWSGVGGALYQRAAPSLHSATPTQIAEAVRTGPGQMPRFGVAAVPSDQLNDVVGYVRYLDHPRNRGGQPLWYIGPVAEGAIALIVGLGVLLLCALWIGERG